MDIAEDLGVNIHMYADDTQLYVHCSPRDAIGTVSKLELCLERVDRWMVASRLKLNLEKSEMIWVCPNCTVMQHSWPAIKIGTSSFDASDNARLLGVSISADLSFDKHVAKVAGKCFYQLRQLRFVCQSLDADSAATLIRAFISSRVDYCCSLLVGSARSVTDKLQRVMNAAARVITNTGKFERGLSHSMHYELHWLDVPERIQFRVATTVYRCLHNMAPRYLSEMCKTIATSTCRQGLQSVTTSNLVIPRVRRVTYGSCAFSVAGLVCWNGLPDYLKSPDLSFDCFKRQLKTFLFCAY